MGGHSLVDSSLPGSCSPIVKHCYPVTEEALCLWLGLTHTSSPPTVPWRTCLLAQKFNELLSNGFQICCWTLIHCHCSVKFWIDFSFDMYWVLWLRRLGVKRAECSSLWVGRAAAGESGSGEAEDEDPADLPVRSVKEMAASLAQVTLRDKPKGARKSASLSCIPAVGGSSSGMAKHWFLAV